MRAEVDSVSSMRAVDRFLREAEDSVECGMHWAVGGGGGGGVLLTDVLCDFVLGCEVNKRC